MRIGGGSAKKRYGLGQSIASTVTSRYQWPAGLLKRRPEPPLILVMFPDEYSIVDQLKIDHSVCILGLYLRNGMSYKVRYGKLTALC
ncbi:hypothetical protein M0657_004184 [Pyricularia oryzae]|nr:hypothetical protein M0657_004184 [Pyricularia oryzae]KAI7925645.1 hypothetical protein M9X92_003206 [Pyricularia oryzae]